MVRGTTWFICPKCGHRFKAMDIEDRCTVHSVPMPCPKCGTESHAIGDSGVVRRIFSKLTGK